MTDVNDMNDATQAQPEAQHYVWVAVAPRVRGGNVPIGDGIRIVAVYADEQDARRDGRVVVKVPFLPSTGGDRA